jgi:hypothetical protein
MASDFPLFPSLPAELRSRIWRLAASRHGGGGVVLQVHLHGDSLQTRPHPSLAASTRPRRAVLATCRESRGELLSFMTAQLDLTHWPPAHYPGEIREPVFGTLPLDPRRDIVAMTEWISSYLMHFGDGTPNQYPFRHREYDMTERPAWMRQVHRFGIELAPGWPRGAPGRDGTRLVVRFLACFHALREVLVMLAPPPPLPGMPPAPAFALEQLDEVPGWARLSAPEEYLESPARLAPQVPHWPYLVTSRQPNERGWYERQWMLEWCKDRTGLEGRAGEFGLGEEDVARVGRVETSIWVQHP